jgi:hypothetical protein
MSKKSQYPGATPFQQAMNCIGSLIFDRGRAGSLDFSVSTRRIGDATTITVYHPEGVMNFAFTDDELKARDAATAKRRAAGSARRKKG